jgi:hypothetical protein
LPPPREVNHPFEADERMLRDFLDEFATITMADLQSEVLVLPKGTVFVEYARFEEAYEGLKKRTAGFVDFTAENTWKACVGDALCFVVLRTILGLTPPEWAQLATTEAAASVPQGAARAIDSACRRARDFLGKTEAKGQGSVTRTRARAMVQVAVDYIQQGPDQAASETIHRLAKFDTMQGAASVEHAAAQHVPYAVLLYERLLGRAFASLRDANSGLVGDVIESAIEDRLTTNRITYRKTKRAEKVPGFAQAPDFFVPTELNPAAIIEAKITSDDGTARDKVTRVLNLAKLRDDWVMSGKPDFEVIACIDGRGFGVRKEDMRKLLIATRGKVFTIKTLDLLIANTRLREFVGRPE